VSDYRQDVKAIAREVWEMFQDPEHPFDESSSESREGETWMAVSNSRWIERKWQDVLGLSKNVPGLEDLGIDHDRKRVYWYPPYPEYEHWWDFVPREDPEVTVKRLGAAAAMKRDVDEAIEEYDKMRRKRWGVGLGDINDSIRQVTKDARKSGMLGLIYEVAEETGWARPESPEDVLMWMKVVHDTEEDFLESSDPVEAVMARNRVKVLSGFIERLGKLGVKPTVPPWAMKRKRWGLNDVEVDAILEEAKEVGIYGILEQIGGYYGVPIPETAEEILGWLLYARDEDLRVLETARTSYEREENEERLLLLGKFIRKLKMLEVIASSPLWVRERKKWGLMGLGIAQWENEWAILKESERTGELMSTITDNAANMGVRRPESVEEWLAWIDYQIHLDQDHAKMSERPEDRDDYLEYVKLYTKYANALRGLGYKPAPMPWDKERLRWEPT